MLKKGKYFNEIQLDAEKQKITVEYNGIWNCTKRDIEYLEQELTEIKIEKEVYSELLSEIK